MKTPVVYFLAGFTKVPAQVLEISMKRFCFRFTCHGFSDTGLQRQDVRALRSLKIWSAGAGSPGVFSVVWGLFQFQEVRCLPSKLETWSRQSPPRKGAPAQRDIAEQHLVLLLHRPQHVCWSEHGAALSGSQKKSNNFENSPEPFQLLSSSAQGRQAPPLVSTAG